MGTTEGLGRPMPIAECVMIWGCLTQRTSSPRRGRVPRPCPNETTVGCVSCCTRASWTSHQGERFDLDSYLQSNQHGVNAWVDQERLDPELQVVGDTAVLTCVVRDRVDVGSGRPETFVMPMTQTWVRRRGRWVCLAGHTGPRVEDD